MPSPLFAFRLPAQSAQQLREVATLYNGGNESGFLRDMVSAIVSGEPKRIAAFNTQLLHKMGEQLALDFVAKAEAQGRARLRLTAKGGAKRGRRTRHR